MSKFWQASYFNTQPQIWLRAAHSTERQRSPKQKDAPSALVDRAGAIKVASLIFIGDETNKIQCHILRQTPVLISKQ